MMKENLHEFSEQFKKHAGEIRYGKDYLIAPGMNAITDRGKVFAKYDLESNITLVYDAKNGGELYKYFTGEVLGEVDRCQKIIAAGGIPKVQQKFRKYISISRDRRTVSTTKAFQKACELKGFSAIASSDEYSEAKQICHLYDLRDASEKQFMILKTQLGARVGRSHQTEGIQGRHFAAFIAGILRNDLRNRCKALGYDLNTAIRELNFLNIHRAPDNTYMAVQSSNEKQRALLMSYGLWQSDLDFFAKEESTRVNEKVYNQIARLPELHDALEAAPIKRGPGRPKGSKNRPKDATETVTEKRRPGRPKGSKNKPKTVEQEPEKVKRGPGRPKGSKNKPKVAAGGVPMPEAKKKVGRPKGSKNKKGAVNAKQRRAEKRAREEADAMNQG